MLPHQRNKVDISSLNAEEQKLFRLYGKLPSKKDILKNKLKERKYFDSGDYALSKAGKASDVGVTNIGSQHPLPENIPHINASETGSPVKETSHLHSSPMASEQPISAEEVEAEEQA
ncbi:camp-regulated phosphoprotein/endosulfine conserved region-domain-containing protein, partial [Trichophaea hybrida]